jgi:hypothetical protein
MAQSDIDLALQDLEKTRIKSLLFCIIPFCVLTGFSFLLKYLIQHFTNPGVVGTVLIFLFPLFLALILSASVMYPYKDQFRKNIVPKLMSSFFSRSTFSPGKHLNAVETFKSNMFITDSYAGNDYYGLFTIKEQECSVLAEMVRIGVGKHNVGSSHRWLTKSGNGGFHGLFIKIDLPELRPDFSSKEENFVVMPHGRSLSEDISSVTLTIAYNPNIERETWAQMSSFAYKDNPKVFKTVKRLIDSQIQKMEDSQKVQSFVQSYLEKHELTDNLQLIWQASEQVPVEDSEFNSHFVAYAKTPEAKRLIQNSMFRHKFMEIREKWKLPMYFSVQGTKCYVAFSKKNDLFCPSIWVPLNKKTETRLKSDVEELLSLIRSAVSIANAVVL